jgi:hypothetical protein
LAVGAKSKRLLKQLTGIKRGGQGLLEENRMSLKLTGALLTALSLTMASTAAAQSAMPLSLASGVPVERAGAGLDEASQLRGPGLWIAGAVALGLIIWGITELLDNETAIPNSP